MVAEVSYEIALRWMPLDLTDDKSTLVQVMAWCHEATSHYLSQCWLSSLSSYGVARPQWVKTQCRKLNFWCIYLKTCPLYVLCKIPFAQANCFTCPAQKFTCIGERSSISFPSPKHLHNFSIDKWYETQIKSSMIMIINILFSHGGQSKPSCSK